MSACSPASGISAVRPGSPARGLLLRALVKLYDGAKTAEEVKEWLAGKTKAEQAALRENARIKPIIDALRPKVKPAAVDTDAMLGELGDAPF